jgi:hypothetical protein
MPQVKGRPTGCWRCGSKLLHIADDGSGFVLCLICGEILVEAKPVEVLPVDHLMKFAALARMRRHAALVE